MKLIFFRWNPFLYLVIWLRSVKVHSAPFLSANEFWLIYLSTIFVIFFHSYKTLLTFQNLLLQVYKNIQSRLKFLGGTRLVIPIPDWRRWEVQMEVDVKPAVRSSPTRVNWTDTWEAILGNVPISVSSAPKLSHPALICLGTHWFTLEKRGTSVRFVASLSPRMQISPSMCAHILAKSHIIAGSVTWPLVISRLSLGIWGGFIRGCSHVMLAI